MSSAAPLQLSDLATLRQVPTEQLVNIMVVLQKLFEDRKILLSGSLYAATPKIFDTDCGTRLLFEKQPSAAVVLLDLSRHLWQHPGFVLSGSCSSPHILSTFASAVLKELKPIPGLTSRLINRWSCSTILLSYLTLRS